MSESLRDQLLKAGLKPARKPEGARPQTRAMPAHSGLPRNPGDEELDLARAYALRAQIEKAERERRERETRQQAQERRERKRRLHELLDGQSLNRIDAEHPRHFEHAGKISRVYVTAEQLKRINAGELGVVVQAAALCWSRARSHCRLRLSHRMRWRCWSIRMRIPATTTFLRI